MKLVYEYIKIKEDIYEAMATNKPVVALDSSVITNSFSYPLSLQIVLNIKKFLNDNGVALAILGMVDGYINVGLSNKELQAIASVSSGASKIKDIEKKDIPGAIAKKITGSFSTSACLFIANIIGLRVLLSDGVDGIFGKSSINNDIFSTLNELQNANITLVCSGIKPIFSLKETINELKRLNIPIYGYKTSYIPDFYSKNSQYLVDYQIDTLDEMVDILKIKKYFKLTGGQLLVVPTPAEFVLDSILIQNNSRSIKSEILNAKISEENMNLYFFEKMKQQTNGRSLTTHSQLLFYNAKVASALIQKFLNKVFH